MRQVFIKRGEAVVEEVPAPSLEPGSLLVRVTHSCISSGTELSGVRNSAQPLWRRALQHPEEVRKVVAMATGQGLGNTVSVVRGRLAEGLAVGYSVAGLVMEPGEGVDEFRPGDRVACAGTGHASHAEIVRVPRNLVCAVPEGLDMGVASTVALGAIAMQGVRRAQPTLGETFVVIGLGALGQLITQLLKANGCRVIGADLNSARVKIGLSSGVDVGIDPSLGAAPEKILRLTRDGGADGVIIAASSPSDGIVSTAFKMCRRRGRVILVGDVGLSLQRQDIYEKELDFLVSTSYGPGRYDADYENRGVKYPAAYVRWTETRNMEAYLELAASGKVQVGPLIGGEYPVASAAAAYEALEADDAPILSLLTYGSSEPREFSHRVGTPVRRALAGARVRLAVVGPGGFVKAVHLPNLASLADKYALQAFVSRSAPRAAAVSRQFGGYACTDFSEVIADSSVDAVLIGTRHDLHAPMALRALEAGKHVLLEKPLALSAEELAQISLFYERDQALPKPLLLTGFNRRFSPHARRIKEFVMRRASPMIMTYRMNAGFIPPDHWVHGPEGGGRNLGEACHIYDLFTYLTDARVDSVRVQAMPPPSGHWDRSDNFVATLGFADGSIATLIYTSLGHREFPKERMEIFVDGNVVCLDDYCEVTVTGAKFKMRTRVAQKGHLEELQAFAAGIMSGDWPIPLWQQIQATEIALEVQSQFRGG